MPDTATAPQPGAEGASAPQFDVTDETSAAAAIEGLGLLDLGDGENGDDTHSGADAPEDGAGETQPTGEDEGHSDPATAAPPAIEPPKSWSAEDKALFAKLNPETQAVIARRESERDSALSRHVQENADQRKAFEADRTAFATEQQKYLQSLQQLAHLVIPQAKQLEGTDWARIAAENPAEYVRLNGLRDQLRGQLAALNGEFQRVQAAQQQDAQRERQTILAREKTLLAEKVPEFADPEKGAKLGRDLSTHLEGAYGFTGDELGQVVDHRLIAMGVDAMRWRQAEAARAAAEAKRANPAPHVQRPGTTATGDGDQRQARQKIQQLGRTNSTRDAASLLESIL